MMQFYDIVKNFPYVSIFGNISCIYMWKHKKTEFLKGNYSPILLTFSAENHKIFMVIIIFTELFGVKDLIPPKWGKIAQKTAGGKTFRIGRYRLPRRRRPDGRASACSSMAEYGRVTEIRCGLPHWYAGKIYDNWKKGGSRSIPRYICLNVQR